MPAFGNQSLINAEAPLGYFLLDDLDQRLALLVFGKSRTARTELYENLAKAT